MIGWVVVAVVVSALVLVGIGGVVAPRPFASQYGIVVGDPRALAFVRAMGIRDVVIGVLLGLVAWSGSRERAAWALYATALVAVLDLVVVTIDGGAARRGGAAPMPAWLLHAGGVLGLAAAGLVVHAGW
jgi:uncharacterized protein DUF4267